jgi:hypothetical protein
MPPHRTDKQLKLHRHIALLEVKDSAVLDALESTPDWNLQQLRRVSDTAVAVRTDQVETVAAKLRDLGYLPRVVEK